MPHQVSFLRLPDTLLRESSTEISWSRLRLWPRRLWVPIIEAWIIYRLIWAWQRSQLWVQRTCNVKAPLIRYRSSNSSKVRDVRARRLFLPWMTFNVSLKGQKRPIWSSINKRHQIKQLQKKGEPRKSYIWLRLCKIKSSRVSPTLPTEFSLLLRCQSTKIMAISWRDSRSKPNKWPLCYPTPP